MSDNLKLWNALKPVDRKFTKPITGKSYKGDSPNPTYVIQKVTEQLGPIGQKWGFNVKFDRIREGRPHQIVVHQEQVYGPPDANGNAPILSKIAKYEIIREQYHEVCIEVWFDGDSGIRTFDAFGGTPLLYMTKSGTWMHDEDAAKKSLTDAYTKAFSWLGVCADIFLGLFDDKYGPNDSGVAPKPEEQKREPNNTPTNGGYSDGW